MKKDETAKLVKRSVSDRRKNQRFDTTLSVQIRLQPDGIPLVGSGTDVGPNGMRVTTKMPLVEATYVMISFTSASNNTFCEGRVVWTERSKDGAQFEGGIDIQKWGGGIPGQDPLGSLAPARPKPDRRRKKSS